MRNGCNALAIAGGLLAAAALEPVLIGPPYHALGFAMLGLGVLLVRWALVLFHRKGTTFEPHGSPTALVATGPFRFSRNPMYVGMTFALVGVATVVGKLLPFLAAPAFVLTMHAHFIPLEEEELERLLGQEYLDDKRRVRRWL